MVCTWSRGRGETGVRSVQLSPLLCVRKVGDFVWITSIWDVRGEMDVSVWTCGQCGRCRDQAQVGSDRMIARFGVPDTTVGGDTCYIGRCIERW